MRMQLSQEMRISWSYASSMTKAWRSFLVVKPFLCSICMKHLVWPLIFIFAPWYDFISGSSGLTFSIFSECSFAIFQGIQLVVQPVSPTAVSNLSFCGLRSLAFRKSLTSTVGVGLAFPPILRFLWSATILLLL